MFLCSTDIINPALVIGMFVESELWPNLIDVAHTRGAHDTRQIVMLNTFDAFSMFSFTLLIGVKLILVKRENIISVVPTLELSIRPRTVA